MLVLWPKAIILIVAVMLTSGCEWFADTTLNDVINDPPYQANAAATSLQRQLTIIDLHADPLMWNRDIVVRSNRGHVDVPRLLDGNVSLQVFGIVTAVPFPPKMENNQDKWDILNLIASLQDWPEPTHTSRLQRALYQADKLTDRIYASNGKLQWVTNQRELLALLKQRANHQQVIGALLSLEGAHALEGEVANIDKLYEAGFRMLGLAHHIDNAMAGSTHGTRKYGLTDKGRQLVQRAVELGIIIDLSHASAQAIDDVIDMVDVPVIASHGGVRGTCDTARNLQDRHIHAIANSGGVIGIGLYKYATCGNSINDTVRAIRYVTDLVGIEHVALGSDFDGSVTTVFDASGWVTLTEALLNAGFNAQQIRAIMGGNALRVFTQVLPTGREVL